MSVTRREFLATSGSFVLNSAAVGAAVAAMGPNDKFDLVIKGGDAGVPFGRPHNTPFSVR
jgi:dihydroorotase